MCASTLLSFHQLYIVCQSTNGRYMQSLDVDAYEHHVVKNQVTGDTSELLELQSSFSREIENEIMHMHESKEAFNEAESEIAANAAVTELERIGSSENISLVEDVAIENFNSSNATKSDVLNKKTDTNASNIEKSSKSVLISTETSPKTNENSTKSKAKKETMKKPKRVDTKIKINAKEKQRIAKASKADISKNSSKAEILKENVPQTTNNKTAKNKSQTIEPKVMGNNHIENTNQE